MNTVDFTSDITILVGDNGSGKSTFVEALAVSVNSITVGEESIQTDKTLLHARTLAENLKLTWNEKTRKGFFMRAEDFFQYTKRMNELKQEMEEDIKRVDEEFKNRSKTAQIYARSGYASSAKALEDRYGKDSDAHSHGEGFLEFFKTRFVPGGLYILDEPEAPLSPISQLSFLMLLQEMIKQDSQFIIATHSPIIMAYPEASIYSFDGGSIHSIQYKDIESVHFMKNFLANPSIYLQYLTL